MSLLSQIGSADIVVRPFELWLDSQRLMTYRYRLFQLTLLQQRLPQVDVRSRHMPAFRYRIAPKRHPVAPDLVALHRERHQQQ